MNGPIDWGKLKAKSRRPNRHDCTVNGCPNKTTARYCRKHMAELKIQTEVPPGAPSLRELRERNQERLRKEVP